MYHRLRKNDPDLPNVKEFIGEMVKKKKEDEAAGASTQQNGIDEDEEMEE
jgi:hypothetical protein